MAYLHKLRGIIAQRGAQDIVYIDECGFEPEVCRRHGWSQRGHKVHGDHSGHRRPRTSLIAARRGKDLLAPMLFSGTADAALVNDWTRRMLRKELRPDSTLIWTMPLSQTERPRGHRRDSGHHILFLPPYSPDFSRIEPYPFNRFRSVRSRLRCFRRRS